MNRNFLIAIVIGAAAVIAYFILSSPSEAEKDAAGATGLPGTGGLGTGAAPSGSSSSGNPLAELLNGVISGGGPAVGLAEQSVIGRFPTEQYGYVTIYGSRESPNIWAYLTIDSTGEKVMPDTDKFRAIQAYILAKGKIVFTK